MFRPEGNPWPLLTVHWPCSTTRGPGSAQKAESLNQVVNGPSDDHTTYQLGLARPGPPLKDVRMAVLGGPQRSDSVGGVSSKTSPEHKEARLASAPITLGAFSVKINLIKITVTAWAPADPWDSPSTRLQQTSRQPSASPTLRLSPDQSERGQRPVAAFPSTSARWASASFEPTLPAAAASGSPQELLACTGSRSSLIQLGFLT
ncbi:uncharacterized protein LOC124247086 isoform X1 [Equus quagga]|uniref:uncharacterized protein LOC124247086 isoform X1 n=1 Tax=Equus quagga TaxID=89248 RepID=UPI001D046F1D|nr:uncharacterized protein LOC123276468 isoform X1 [Equus asinus]XP_046532039.1 uncharacterized protein LOC124247086 isoform X1 [Equus quagga]